VNGQTGEGTFQTAVEVVRTKPAPENGALRFLWARHKITLLSDYNRLRKDDRRVREATDLGLQYNLLTAYTSFVAIDTEMRNKNGRPTEVRQPLPLPQGVSDYAVGGKAMMTAVAPAPLSANRVAKESADEALSRPTEKKREERERQDRVQIKDGKGSGNINSEEVRRIVDRHWEEIRGCLPRGMQAVTLTLTLHFQPGGQLGEVVLVTKNLNGVEKCLTERFQKWAWPATLDGKPGEVTVTISPGA
jgi:Ca-activated chloride channel family protein